MYSNIITAALITISIILFCKSFVIRKNPYKYYDFIILAYTFLIYGMLNHLNYINIFTVPLGYNLFILANYINEKLNYDHIYKNESTSF